MAKNTRLSTLVVNAQADALARLADAGFLDLYDGTQPKSADDPITTQRLGVSLRLGSPAFMPSEDGEIRANQIGSSVAVADIKATWGRVTQRDHKTPVLDQSVGTSNANIVLPTTNIGAGVTVSVSSWTHQVAKATTGS